jgi:hypothetical protein
MGEEGEEPQVLSSALAFRQHKLHGVPSFYMRKQERKMATVFLSMFEQSLIECPRQQKSILAAIIKGVSTVRKQ